MKQINFTEQEASDIKNIIDQYRTISDELLEYQKKAEEIQRKVIRLTAKMDSIKKEEDSMMTKLHKKYGKFSLQDIYNTIYNAKQ